MQNPRQKLENAARPIIEEILSSNDPENIQAIWNNSGHPLTQAFQILLRAKADLIEDEIRKDPGFLSRIRGKRSYGV